MQRVTPTSLDEATADAALGALHRRFPWLRESSHVLQQWVGWQDSVEPKPSFYFRWHLPRYMVTLKLIEQVARASASLKILDLATYAPYSLLMEQHLWKSGYQPEIARTSFDGEPVLFTSPLGVQQMATTALTLGDAPFPFEDHTFDLVILTEVIEHLVVHPQPTLLEMNRVCAPGGHVLVSTPNVTSWKKIRALSNGDWNYDSPSFGCDWGHRYEFSFYQVHQMLAACGFRPVAQVTQDVYFDDPTGIAQAIEFAGLVGFKALTGQLKSAFKLATRRGSGLFFLYEKIAHPESPDMELVII